MAEGKGMEHLVDEEMQMLEFGRFDVEMIVIQVTSTCRNMT